MPVRDWRRRTDTGVKPRATRRNACAPVVGRRPAYARPTLSIYGSVSGLTRGFSGTVADFFMIANPRMGMLSDRTLKEDIVRIGTHPLGIGLYLFVYKPEVRERWGSGKMFGAMADEVETVLPQAVSLDAEGRRMVNYAMLGIRIASRDPKSKT